jgi:N-acetylglucosaminyl-diphospho-decaprenol L-rhamnosyltransferase
MNTQNLIQLSCAKVSDCNIKLTIIIVSFNTCILLKRCIESIFHYPPSASYEVIIVDNASSDDSPGMVHSSFPQVKLLRSAENVGFAAANNQALQVSSGECILFLNSDTEIFPGSIEPLLRHFEAHPETGIVGPTQQFENGTAYPTICPSPDLSFVFLNHTGLRNKFYRNRWFNKYRFLWEMAQTAGKPIEVDWLSGASLMVRRQVLEEVGFFDENYFFYMEETDLCERAKKAGWKVHFVPEARIIHHGGQSTGKAKSGLLTLSAAISEIYFFKKHRGLINLFLLKIFMLIEYSLKSVIVKADDPRRWAYKKILRMIFKRNPLRIKREDIY